MKIPSLLTAAARGPLVALLLLGSFAGCGGEDGEPPAPPPEIPATWDFGLPAGYPKPKIPADNPMTVDKVELGRRLFYDKRLSGNETQSCASCHDQKLAFTDGRAGGLGSTGEVHPRGSMSIVNVGYLSTLTWANPLITELEEQALLPLFGETPVELGLAGKEDVLLERLREDPVYQALFPKVFPDEADPVRLPNVVRAIGAFERSVISYRSAWDRYNYGGDSMALSEAQKRGKDLFFSEKLECFHCHGGFNFSDSVEHDGTTFTETMFHNTGLYNIGGTGAYPENNRGVYEVTQVSTDMGRFRAPTLRNITLTAPYMHDGSIATLGEVLDHYAAGGRTIAEGPYAGVGSTNPYKSELINGFTLTEAEKADVLAFLASLTDEALLVDPRFADPWKQDSAGGMP
ncbi:methanobactin export MATE transporter MbnM [Polyangium sp. 15x6]|uniref:methanobactin export MATE transporter MbnM n=1 Tax=Polyangium sp. 15x6 TaxID=3042687 RepID=UPI00249BD69E|nr:methanobactin export MATE transporter MbnM [Polyangium sp. 15x6]MDI3287613.1 di-heme enzyme [Polyangium sp. 15x6]